WEEAAPRDVSEVVDLPGQIGKISEVGSRMHVDQQRPWKALLICFQFGGSREVQQRCSATQLQADAAVRHADPFLAPSGARTPESPPLRIGIEELIHVVLGDIQEGELDAILLSQHRLYQLLDGV